MFTSFLESFRLLYVLFRSDPLRFKFLFALRHFYSLMATGKQKDSSHGIE